MLNPAPSLNFPSPQPVAAGDSGTPVLEEARAANPIATAKHELNAQIIKSSLSVSIGAGDEPQALVLRSALDRINEILAPELGPNAIENAMGQDNSPEATADRILMMTGFLENFKTQHPGMDSDAATQKFVDQIRKGFEQGFKEASDILDGLGVLQGGVKEGIMKTYELVQKGLDDFLNNNLSTRPEQPAPETAG